MAGDVRLDAARAPAVASHSNFSSVRANVAVFAGKWAFEATLGSSGIMQLGWCTARCPFTHEHGVGDAQDLFARRAPREEMERGVSSLRTGVGRR